MVALGERTTPNGQELLAEFIQYGHQKPFEEIVRRYAGMVYNVCYRITKDKHEAEDATQAVFLTLALQAKRGAEIKALGPWLQQVGKRLALDTRRSKKRRINREERHHAEQTVRRESLLDDALPSADLDELKTILHEELQKLPAKYRMPLILHYFGGLTREEMAVELNCKPSTLGVRIFRGREMLAGRLSNRGIHISAGMLAAVLGYAVKRAVSDTLIASTSHAATAIMAGYDGAGFASAHVIGLTRRATSAMALGKVRMAAITLMMAGTSLGAGAKVLGILPQIDVRQIISNQLKRMVRPLIEPFSQPLHVDAKTPPSASTTPVAHLQTPPLNIAQVIQQVNPPIKSVDKPATLAQNTAGNGGGGNSGGGILIESVSAPARSAWTRGGSLDTGGTALASDSAAKAADRISGGDDSAGAIDAVSASNGSQSSGAAGGGGLGALAASSYHLASPMASISSSVDSSHSSDIVFGANDLYVGLAAQSLASKTGTTSSANPDATPMSMIQIQAVGGSVTENSAGTVRGWGQIDRTGTLVVNGKVVADGEGVDRTLNLSTFTSVQTSVSSSAGSIPVATPVSSSATSLPVLNAGRGISTPVASTSGISSSTATHSASSSVSTSSAPPTGDSYTLTTAPVSQQLCGDGWYAINHGRLSLPLLGALSNPSVLTWGDDPDSPSLSLVNSVRITLPVNSATSTSTPGGPLPTELSLLATDRSDVPDRFQIGGAPIGLWQVDPGGPDLEAADITIDYNSVLASLLGAPPTSVELWTFSDDTGAWQPVAPSSFSLDTTDHLVSGYATDVNDIAVTVDPAPGENIDQVLANHLAELSNTSSDGAASGVPEPVALPMLLMGAMGLLGRRRRQTNR